MLSAKAMLHWRWQPGMLGRGSDNSRWRLCFVDRRGWGLSAFEEGAANVVIKPLADCGLLLPDLSDEATAGCLPAIVRAAWGDSHAQCSRLYIAGGVLFVRVQIYTSWEVLDFDAPTPLKAWIKALERAPVTRPTEQAARPAG